MLSKYLIPAAALLAATANSYHSEDIGMTASASLDVIHQFKDTYIWSVLGVIHDIDLPDIEDDQGNYARNNSFHTSELIYDLQFLWLPQVNGFSIVAQRVKFSFSCCNFSYALLVDKDGNVCDEDDESCEETVINHECPKNEAGEYIRPDGPDSNMQGGFTATFNTVTLATGFKFSTQELNDGRIMPKVEPYDVIVDINKNDLTIDIWGGIIPTFADTLKLFFEKKICTKLTEALLNLQEEVIPNKINAAIAQSQGITDLPGADWALDWEMLNRLQFTTHGLEVGAKGLFFDKAVGENPPAVAVPELPTFIESIDSGIQVYISTWTMDSFTASYLSASSLEGWLTSGLTGITCGKLEVAFPGISKYYGASQPVDIFFDVISLTDFGVNAKNSELALNGEVMLKFQVQTIEGTTEIATQLTLQDIKIEASLLPQRMDIVPQLKTANVNKVVVNSCAFGRLSGLTLKVEINNGIRLAKPMINKILQGKPIHFPESVLDNRITFSELSISYHDDFIGLGITPRFHTLKGELGTSVLITEDDLAFLQ